MNAFKRRFSSLTGFKSRLLFTCIFAAFSAVSLGQGQAVDSETATMMTDHIAAWHAAHPGASVSMAMIHGGSRFQAHFGQRPNGQLADNASLYEIGSLTKTYTGILLAQAVREGRMKLDDPVQNYLPAGEYGNLFRRGKVVTVRDIAVHTSGLPVNLRCHEPALSLAVRYECYQLFDKAAFFEALKGVSLLDTPGKRYRYSNAGHRLLTYLLEQQMEKPYAVLLDEIVFSRTGETQTLLRLTDKPGQSMVQGLDAQMQPMPASVDLHGGSGSLKASTSSIQALMQWYLSSDDPLALESMQLLAGNADTLGRAYVWNTFEYSSSRPMLYHAGGTFGTSSWIALYPAQQLGVFLVINKVTPSMQEELNQVANRIVDDVLNP